LLPSQRNHIAGIGMISTISMKLPGIMKCGCGRQRFLGFSLQNRVATGIVGNGFGR
jgi:hypothetical protein